MRIESLLKMLESSPNEPFLWFALAKEYEKAGEQEKAYTFYQKLVEEQPDYIGTYYHFGKWYEQQKQPEKALDIYNRGIEKAKAAGDRHAWSELAEAKMGVEE